MTNEDASGKAFDLSRRFEFLASSMWSAGVDAKNSGAPAVKHVANCSAYVLDAARQAVRDLEALARETPLS